jgi:hypothetical protein
MCVCRKKHQNLLSGTAEVPGAEVKGGTSLLADLLSMAVKGKGTVATHSANEELLGDAMGGTGAGEVAEGERRSSQEQQNNNLQGLATATFSMVMNLGLGKSRETLDDSLKDSRLALDPRYLWEKKRVIHPDWIYIQLFCVLVYVLSIYSVSRRRPRMLRTLWGRRPHAFGVARRC